MHAADTATPALLCPQDQGRADVYALIASMLLEPPPPHLLEGLATVSRVRGLTPLERAWQALCDAAREQDVDDIAAEHEALFRPRGRLAVDPRASRYAARGVPALPLTVLRADLRGLGLTRRAEATPSEEHLGALCETLRLLITGAPGVPRAAPSVQRRFFAAHLAPWFGACLACIRHAGAGPFHVALADFAQAFLEAECEAFGIEPPCMPMPEPAPPPERPARHAPFTAPGDRPSRTSA